MEIKGHSLSSRDFEEGNVFFEDWKPELKYKWDAGVAIGKFLMGLKKGIIYGRVCNKCKRVMVPPRMFCEWCFRETDEWMELKDTGRVNTFSISFYDKDVNRIEKPIVPAVIEIDGASPGMGFLHVLGEVGETLEEILKNVKIGMRVKAVWKREEERQGEITDILYFRPLREGEE